MRTMVLIDCWLYRVGHFYLRKAFFPSIVYILSISIFVVCPNMKGSCSVKLGHDVSYIKIGGRTYYIMRPPKKTPHQPICLGKSEQSHGDFGHAMSKQERS